YSLPRLCLSDGGLQEYRVRRLRVRVLVVGRVFLACPLFLVGPVRLHRVGPVHRRRPPYVAGQCPPRRSSIHLTDWRVHPAFSVCAAGHPLGRAGSKKRACPAWADPRGRLRFSSIGFPSCATPPRNTRMCLLQAVNATWSRP